MEIEYKSKAWLMMQFLHDFGPQRREQLAGEDPTALGIMKAMLASRLFCQCEDKLIGLSLRGKNRLQKINQEAATNDLEIVERRTHTTGSASGTYDGKELGRTCVRPGAYDAYELPSLIGGKRIKRRAA